jgi:hypothetical protein
MTDETNDNLLIKLHKDLCEKLLELIKKEEVSSAELNVIRQFLKDNRIEGLPNDDSALGKLVQELPEEFRNQQAN